MMMTMTVTVAKMMKQICPCNHLEKLGLQLKTEKEGETSCCNFSNDFELKENMSRDFKVISENYFS